MTNKKFKQKKQEIANRLFELTRELEELKDEAEEKWCNAKSEDRQEYWDEVKNNLDNQVTALDDIYAELDEGEED